jgi:hypothetical protein
MRYLVKLPQVVAAIRDVAQEPLESESCNVSEVERDCANTHWNLTRRFKFRVLKGCSGFIDGFIR